MKTTTLTASQTAELLHLRAERGLCILDLAARFKVGVDRVKEIVGTLGLSERYMNSRIARCIRRQPEWSDEQVSTECQCLPERVAHRRPQIKLNQNQRDLAIGVSPRDSVDRGKRLSITWLRQNCSRGERDLRQIQTMCQVSGLRYTLAELRASCLAAGLSVPSAGPVYFGTRPRKPPVTRPEGNAKVGER